MQKIKIIHLAWWLSLGFVACSPRLNVAKVIAAAEKQTAVLLEEVPKAKVVRAIITTGGTPGATGELVSPRTLETGELKLVASRDWTSGFFPGVLWFLNEYTAKDEWKRAAQFFTANIEMEKLNATTHDMGFKIYCSFGTGYRLTNDQQYKEVIVQAAKTLSSRFNPIVGTLRSWDHNRVKWGFPVIIDNMMNLELLFAATQLTGDSSFHKIAVSHATKTAQNHFRPDYSSYHVIDYDTTSGIAVQKQTHQGYSHSSAWARGQAWALYGYTMCYRFTKEAAFLRQAEGVASFILNHKHLPGDLVPYWDFDAPNIPTAPRDASAAAINASALFELSMYSNKGQKYQQAADKILKNLTNNYRSPIGQNKGFILLHSTGAAPSKSEVDVPLSYADYYYLEAILRKQKLDEGRSLF